MVCVIRHLCVTRILLTLDFQVATPRGNVRSQLSLFFCGASSPAVLGIPLCVRVRVCVDMYGPVKHNVM